MDEAAILAGLPGWSLAFMLVLCRAGAVVMLMPGLGEMEPPPILRAGFALVLTLLLLPVVQPRIEAGLTEGSIAGAVLSELAAGGLLGWLARLPALALGMAGAIISYMTGLTSVVQPDPALGGQSAVLTRAMGLLVPVLVLGTGLYALPLQALVGSYEVLPPGSALGGGPALEAVVAALSDAFGLALRIASPFILVSVLLQVALGLVARLVPQFQVFAASAPGQILGGLVLLALLSAPLLATWLDQLRSSWSGLPGA